MESRRTHLEPGILRILDEEVADLSSGPAPIRLPPKAASGLGILGIGRELSYAPGHSFRARRETEAWDGKRRPGQGCKESQEMPPRPTFTGGPGGLGGGMSVFPAVISKYTFFVVSEMP